MSIFNKLRGWYENFSTVRNIFLSLGWWTPLIVLLTPIGVIIWSYLKHLPGSVIFVLALFTLASVVELSIRLPEMFRRSINVTLTPAIGPASIQLLAVKNLGSPLTLRAECTLLDRRNDPNILHRSTFRMEWEGSQKRAVKLRRGGSCNLVVAQADRISDMYTMEICGLSQDSQREEKESSRWYHEDKLPEYDLKITIIGEDHRPHVECFTVRAGQASALEMSSILSG